jgi:hypothetical protein
MENRRRGANAMARCTKPSRRVRGQRFSWLRFEGGILPIEPYGSPLKSCPVGTNPTGKDCASSPYRRTRINGYHVAFLIRRVRRWLSVSVSAGSLDWASSGDARACV